MQERIVIKSFSRKDGICTHANEKSLNSRIMMLCNFSQMWNFALYFLFKSVGKFKSDLNHSSYFPYSSYYGIFEWIFLSIMIFH